ncbi:MAG: M28 family metallopeptidase [Rhodoplanes sp.]
MTEDVTLVDAAATEPALAVVATLAGEIGGRRPASRSERLAAEVVRDALRGSGVEAVTEPFAGYSSFGYPYGVVAALASAPALLPRRRRGVRGAIAAIAATALAGEGGLVHTPLSRLLSRGESRNVTATIEPRRAVERTVCVMAHLDTSRSGLLFDPRFAGILYHWIALQSLATLILPAEPLLARTGPGRALVATARSVCVVGLALLVERELRGADVPGANDNASGVGAVVQLAAEAAAAPLEATRLVVLLNGCEESGLLGAQAYLRAHDTSGWLFLNFDGVGAPATLRYLPSEGLLRKWAADPSLVTLAERIRGERPELGLEPADGAIGLTYDATAVLARGGRALTFVAGDGGRIPNYHQPSDTVENLDLGTLARAIAVGRAMIEAIDRGQAD